MTNPKVTDDRRTSNLEKDPEDWVTGDEPMTGAQKSYLKTLSEEAGETFNDSLTKAQAAERIEELQKKTGRGQRRGRGAGGGERTCAASTGSFTAGPARTPSHRPEAMQALLAPHGLLVRGHFHPAGGGTVVLVGNAGPAMWEAFRRARRPQDAPHELDAWTRRVIEPIAADLGAQAVFPFEGPPYHPFQRWAMAAEGLRASPVGVLLHPEHGPWHAYRAALLFPRRLPLHSPPPPAHPCETCAERPCLSACPVGAFPEGQGYDVAACRGHVRGRDGTACRGGGCLARHACPIGTPYAPEQAAFHMAAFAGAGAETDAGEGVAED